MISQLKKLKQGHWPIFLLSNISSIVNMILPIVLVRLFSPSDMGLYKTFFLYLSLIPFITMAGGPLNAIYYWMGKNELDRHEYLKSTWMATTLLSAFIFIAGLIIFIFFRHAIIFSPHVFLFLLISGFLVCPSGHFSEVCIARGQTMLGAGLSMSFELIKTLGFILIAYKYQSIDMIFSYFFTMMVISFIFMIYLGIKTDTITFTFDSIRVKEILKYSLPISLSAFLIFIIDKADQIIISGLVPADIFAYYSLGCLIIPPLYLLESSVQKHLIPKLSFHYEQNNFHQAGLDYKKAIGDIAFLVIPAVFGLVFFAKPIINLLYTSQYESSVIFLQIFSLSYLLLLIPHDSILRASGKTATILKIYIFLTPFSFLLIFLSVKHLGVAWALLTSLIIKLLPKIYCFVASARIIKSQVTELIPTKKICEYLILSIVLTVVCYLIRGLFQTEIQWFLVCAPIFAIIYLLTFISLQFKKS